MLYLFVKKAMEDYGMFLGLDIGPPGQGCLQNCAAMSACRSHPLDFKVRKLGLMHEICEITLSVCFPLAEDGTSHISGGVLRSGSTGGGGGGGGLTVKCGRIAMARRRVREGARMLAWS